MLSANQKTALSAALISFLAYTCIFSFRKAFSAAAFSREALWGMDYKVVLVVTQVMGYMLSKFAGIKFIAELQKKGRGRLIVYLVSISWLAWLLFAIIPAPYNFWALFFNGFPLGMLWGVVFSFVEGRRSTDFIGAMLAVSFIFGSGIAKSTGQLVMQQWQVSEYWMPFTVGAIFFFPLLLFVYLLERIPLPDTEDIKHRTERLPMQRTERLKLVKRFFPGILLLVITYILVTILREVRDSFMADMWKESGAEFSSTGFAQTETLISLVLLAMVAVMVFIINNFKAFVLSQSMMLLGFLLTGTCTLLFTAHSISMFWWMTLVGLGLYMVYLPFNSNLFDRFLASFKITGTAGFLIYVADSFGYLGSVTVLFSKSILKLQMQWLEFYVQLVQLTSVVGFLSIAASLYYFLGKKKRTDLTQS